MFVCSLVKIEVYCHIVFQVCAQSYARFLVERICTKSNLIKRKTKRGGCIGGFLERVVIDFNARWLSAKSRKIFAESRRKMPFPRLLSRHSSPRRLKISACRPKARKKIVFLCHEKNSNNSLCYG